MQVLSQIPWWGWLIIVCVALMALSVLLKVFRVFDHIYSGFVWFLKLIFAVISAPFRLIAWIVRKCRSRQDNAR